MVNKIDWRTELIGLTLLSIKYRNPELLEKLSQGGSECTDENEAAYEIAAIIVERLKSRLKSSR